MKLQHSLICLITTYLRKENTNLESVSKNKKTIKAVKGMMNSTLEWAEDIYVKDPFGGGHSLEFQKSIEYLDENPDKIWTHVVRGGFVNPATAMKIDYTTRLGKYEAIMKFIAVQRFW